MHKVYDVHISRYFDCTHVMYVMDSPYSECSEHGSISVFVGHTSVAERKLSSADARLTVLSDE